MLYPSELQPLPQILSRAACYAACSFLLFAHPALIAARCAADSLLLRSLLPRPDALPFDIALIAALIWDSFPPIFSDTASSFDSSFRSTFNRSISNPPVRL
jgi:hypothetical protein